MCLSLCWETRLVCIKQWREFCHNIFKINLHVNKLVNWLGRKTFRVGTLEQGGWWSWSSCLEVRCSPHNITVLILVKEPAILLPQPVISEQVNTSTRHCQWWTMNSEITREYAPISNFKMNNKIGRMCAAAWVKCHKEKRCTLTNLKWIANVYQLCVRNSGFSLAHQSSFTVMRFSGKENGAHLALLSAVMMVLCTKYNTLSGQEDTLDCWMSIHKMKTHQIQELQIK
jgi:hypothetical protein